MTTQTPTPEKAIKVIAMVRNKDNRFNDWCEIRLIEEIIGEIK